MRPRTTTSSARISPLNDRAVADHQRHGADVAFDGSVDLHVALADQRSLDQKIG